MKLAESLEDKGVVDLSVLGDSKIRNWDAIKKLSAKQIDALIRYDDWDDKTKTALEKIKKAKIAAKKKKTNSDESKAKTSNKPNKPNKDTKNNTVSQAESELKTVDDKAETLDTETKVDESFKNSIQNWDAVKKFNIKQIDALMKHNWDDKTKATLEKIKESKLKKETNSDESKAKTSNKPNKDTKNNIISQVEPELKTVDDKAETLVNPGVDTDFTKVPHIPRLMRILNDSDTTRLEPQQEVNSKLVKPQLDNDLTGHQEHNGILEGVLKTIQNTVLPLSPMGALVNHIRKGKTNELIPEISDLPGLGFASVIPNIVKFFTPDTSKETKPTPVLPSFIIDTLSGKTDILNDVISLSPIGALANSIKDTFSDNNAESTDVSKDTSPKLSDEQKSIIDHYVSQGLNNPQMLSVTTDIPPNLIKSYLQSSKISDSNGLYTPVPPKAVQIAKSSNSLNNESNETPIVNSIVNIDGGSNNTEPFRLTDRSLEILSQI